MSSHESTPSGSQEISRRGLLAGILAGAGAATLAACGREAIPVGTSETPEAPTTPSETPSVEVTPSETQTPEAIDLHSLNIDMVENMTDEGLLELVNKFDSLSDAEFYELDPRVSDMYSAAFWTHYKNKGWMKSSSREFGYVSGSDISKVNPYKMSSPGVASWEDIIASILSKQQIAMVLALKPESHSYESMTRRLMAAFQNRNMNLSELSDQVASVSDSLVVDTSRTTHGGIHPKSILIEQIESIINDTGDTPVKRFLPRPGKDVREGSYTDPITGEIYDTAMLIPVMEADNEKYGAIFAVVFVPSLDDPSIGTYKLIGYQKANEAVLDYSK